MAEPVKPPPGVPTPPGAPGEPSMEEILASIRRILNEDEQGSPQAAPAAEERPAEPEDDPGVLQLTEEMLVPPDQPAPAPPAEPDPPPSPAAPAPPAFQPPAAPAPDPAPGEGLLAAGATAAAAAALGQLARPAAVRGPAPPAWPVGAAGLTVEEIVRQELRPLLSAWLNAHLPRIVEEAVARELERVRARVG